MQVAVQYFIFKEAGKVVSVMVIRIGSYFLSPMVTELQSIELKRR